LVWAGFQKSSVGPLAMAAAALAADVLATLLLVTAAAPDEVARLDVTLEAALDAVALDAVALDAAALVVTAVDDGAPEDGAALAAVLAVPVAVLPQAARRPRTKLDATRDSHLRRDRRTVGMDSSLPAVAPGYRWLGQRTQGGLDATTASPAFACSPILRYHIA